MNNLLIVRLEFYGVRGIIFEGEALEWALFRFRSKHFLPLLQGGRMPIVLMYGGLSNEND